MNHTPIQISKEEIEQLFNFPSLIDTLREAFAEDSYVPQRQHHDFPMSSGHPDRSAPDSPARILELQRERARLLRLSRWRIKFGFC